MCSHRLEDFARLLESTKLYHLPFLVVLPIFDVGDDFSGVKT